MKKKKFRKVKRENLENLNVSFLEEQASYDKETKRVNVVLSKQRILSSIILIGTSARVEREETGWSKERERERREEKEKKRDEHQRNSRGRLSTRLRYLGTKMTKERSSSWKETVVLTVNAREWWWVSVARFVPLKKWNPL